MNKFVDDGKGLKIVPSKLGAASRLKASFDKLSLLNHITGMGITKGQAEGKGWRLTTKQDLKALTGMIKKHGGPTSNHRVGSDICKQWEVEGVTVSFYYDGMGNGTGLITLE